MKALLIGSSGVISELITCKIKMLNFEVITMGTSDEADIYCDISNKTTWPTDLKFDLIILNSWIMHPRTQKNASLNLAFAEHISSLCAKSNTQTIFISTQSAKSDSKSKYGKTKFKAQRIFEIRGQQILRPGLFLGQSDKNDSLNAANILNRLAAINPGIVLKSELIIPIFRKIDFDIALERVISSKEIKIIEVISEYIDVNTLILKANKRVIFKISNKIVSLIFANFFPGFGSFGTLKDKWISLEDSSVY